MSDTGRGRVYARKQRNLPIIAKLLKFERYEDIDANAVAVTTKVRPQQVVSLMGMICNNIRIWNAARACKAAEADEAAVTSISVEAPGSRKAPPYTLDT